MTSSSTLQTFAYRAAHLDGRIERGRLEAQSHDAALRALSDQGLYPVELAVAAWRPTRRASLPAAELALTLRILADLTDSGLPMGRALQALETLAPPRLAAVLPAIRQAIHEGSSLTRALEQTPLAIPEVVLGVVRAGERGSGLAAAIRHAAELTEQSAANAAALRSALVYPATLAVFGTATVCLLVGTVLPRFALILSDLGQSLPPTTRLVLGAAAFARVSLLPSLVVLIVASIAWRAWVATDLGRLRWDGLLLRLPLAGDVLMASATASFCSALAALLESGVPVVAALPSAARATGNAALVARLTATRTAVEEGSRLSAALVAHEASTSVVDRLVKAGEESGRLGAMLAHAARIERERAMRRLQSAVRMIEPSLIVVFGGIVALVAAALLQALYSARPGS